MVELYQGVCSVHQVWSPETKRGEAGPTGLNARPRRRKGCPNGERRLRACDEALRARERGRPRPRRARPNRRPQSRVAACVWGNREKVKGRTVNRPVSLPNRGVRGTSAPRETRTAIMPARPETKTIMKTATKKTSAASHTPLTHAAPAASETEAAAAATPPARVPPARSDRHSNGGAGRRVGGHPRWGAPPPRRLGGSAHGPGAATRAPGEERR